MERFCNVNIKECISRLETIHHRAHMRRLTTSCCLVKEKQIFSNIYLVSVKVNLAKKNWINQFTPEYFGVNFRVWLILSIEQRLCPNFVKICISFGKSFATVFSICRLHHLKIKQIISNFATN